MKNKIIQREEFKYDCQKCEHYFLGTKYDVQCPSCDSFDIKLRGGEDFK